METLGIGTGLAEDALVLLAGHVEPDVVLGRPVLAYAAGDSDVVVIADAGGREVAWWVSAAQASRVVALPRGWLELTCWRAGEEVSRTVHTEQDLELWIATEGG